MAVEPFIIMEPYIQISKINDFMYCPVSIYLHSLYENFNTRVYHQTPQVTGTLNHESIETGTYTTARRFIMGLEVSSERYNLVGKIDVYDRERKALIERKTRVKTVYPGYRYQLYAQYFCMKEMGFEVRSLFIHSLEDNKRYRVPLPKKREKEEFEAVLRQMREFGPDDIRNHSCERCAKSIYGALSW